MRKTTLFILFLAATAFSQDAVSGFRYSAKAAIPVGTVLHYVKTNVDGTKPEFVSQYIASKDTLESFKFHPQGDRAGLVIARMAWRHFAAAKLTSWRVTVGDKRELFGTIDFDFEKGIGTTRIPSVSDEADTFPMPISPVHLYNFDLASLNFALPHLSSPTSPLTFGIADPTFGASSKLVEFKGSVSMSFVSDETRNGRKARKYRLNGPGLQNRGGYVWINKKAGWIEDIEIDLPDNPEWNSFKLKLQRTELMTPAKWERFQADQF